jgi:hypothetical protein
MPRQLSKKRTLTTHELAILLEVDEKRVGDFISKMRVAKDGDKWVFDPWFLSLLEDYRRLKRMEVEFDVRNIDENNDGEFLFPQENLPDLAGEVVKLYNEMLGGVLPPVRFRSEWREKMIRARTKQYLKNLEGWRRYFEIVLRSPFLLGKKGVNWRANFDWLIRPNNMTKVLDGVYLEGTYPEYEKMQKESDIRTCAVMKRDISLLISTFRKISAAVKRGEYYWMILPKQQNKMFMTRARLALAVSSGVINTKNYSEFMDACGFKDEDIVFVLSEDYYEVLQPLLEAGEVGELGAELWTKNVTAAAVGILRGGEDLVEGHGAFLSAITGAYDVIGEREGNSRASKLLSKVLVPAGTFAEFFGKRV